MSRNPNLYDRGQKGTLVSASQLGTYGNLNGSGGLIKRPNSARGLKMAPVHQGNDGDLRNCFPQPARRFYEGSSENTSGPIDIPSDDDGDLKDPMRLIARSSSSPSSSSSSSSASSMEHPPPKKQKGNAIMAPGSRADSGDDEECINVADRDRKGFGRDVKPSVPDHEPWSVHLFAGILDGFDPDLDGDAETWIPVLVDLFHDEEWRWHRTKKRKKILDGFGLANSKTQTFASSSQEVSSADLSPSKPFPMNFTPMALTNVERAFLSKVGQHPFHYRAILGLSAILYAHPFQVYEHLRSSFSQHRTPHSESKPFIVSDEVAQAVNDGIKGVVDACFNLTSIINCIKDMKTSFMSSGEEGPPDEFVEHFSNSEERWGRFCRLWRPTGEDFVKENMKKSFSVVKFLPGERPVPFRKYSKEMVSSEYFKIPSELQSPYKGCSCSHSVINCHSVDKCECLQYMKGYAYEFNALRDVKDEVYECSPFCACSTTTCQNRLIQNSESLVSFSDYLAVRPSQIHGFGESLRSLKAAKDIPHGTYIGEIVGEIVSPSRIFARNALHKKVGELNLFVLKHMDFDRACFGHNLPLQLYPLYCQYFTSGFSAENF
ncbi:hypothetical protein HDU67_000336 [Dinochytrium kinnereticum]|nr:hypothetical protein HDU67_000336 [Dinochytrium kinnereticum]